MTASSGARSSTAGNGTTTTFTATFRAKEPAGVSVVLQDTDDLEVHAQVRDTDYTVALDADGIPTVTFVTAPASGQDVIIYPTPVQNQEIAPTPGGPLFGTAVEEGYDNLLTLIQGLQDQVNQCIQFSQACAAITKLTILQNAKDKYLYFNATTGQPEFKDLAVIQTELGMLGSHLSAIEALTPSNDNVLQVKSGEWTNRTMAQLWADLQSILPDTLAFSADPNTDIHRSAADTLQLRVGGSAAAQLDANGLTLPLQPAFSAILSADQLNVTGNGTAATVICDNEQVDRNQDYNNATGVFTAPVTGLYLFAGNVSMSAAGSATDARLDLVCTSTTYRLARLAAGSVDVSNAFTLSGAALAYLTAGDTAKLQITVTGEGADTAGIDGGGTALTSFSGQLIS